MSSDEPSLREPVETEAGWLMPKDLAELAGSLPR